MNSNVTRVKYNSKAHVKQEKMEKKEEKRKSIDNIRLLELQKL